MTLISDLIANEERSKGVHHAGTISNKNITRFEMVIKKFHPNEIINTLETGCGKSTVLFSNLSKSHVAFCLDDRSLSDSSVSYATKFDCFQASKVKFEFGPTQLTLPKFQSFKKYDCILIDGPHGYPFPSLEYYFLYPHLGAGALLFIDDVHIPSIGFMFDILKEDDMFEFLGFIGFTGVLKRTGSRTFDPCGDGWWLQNFNRRRCNPSMTFYLDDKKILKSTYELIQNFSALKQYQLEDF